MKIYIALATILTCFAITVSASQLFTLDFNEIPQNAEFSGVVVVMADSYDDLANKARAKCEGDDGAYVEKTQWLVGGASCGERTERFILQCFRYEKKE